MQQIGGFWPDRSRRHCGAHGIYGMEWNGMEFMEYGMHIDFKNVAKTHFSGCTTQKSVILGRICLTDTLYSVTQSILSFGA